ncbi:patatin-like protein 7 [Phtheirospermum japonicum]|uniref:Patatin-like protein 7 n=1 Tax=Phtheirospermum japonicum TaxID=374723 RepID=A0A830BGB6_9LAMI|nr:patatin-like protein 7 [Phtheirospermum japonicum]
MASSPPIDKLTNEIFSILENKFLFGNDDHHNTATQSHRGKVRILSIDAGDGILAAATLLHLQSILRRKSGNPSAHISDFFDVVAGAGAGGILAGLLFTRGKDGHPMLSAEESLRFIVDNRSKLTAQHHSSSRRWGSGRARSKVLGQVFGDSTLRDTVKAVLIPCYDLRSGAPFLFSRADAVEMEGCDFGMAGVCGATVADRAVELRSTDGRKRIVAVGGGVSNPAAAAITHVLNNKQEFPLCKGVEDLLVVSLGNVGADVDSNRVTNTSLLKIAADGAADMVDQAVSMAFGEWRRSNYVRIQGNGINNIVDEMLGQKNVESILFKGKKVGEYTNMERVEMLAGELIKEKERRKYNSMLPTVLLKSMYSSSSPRSSSSAASTPSTLSSSTS